MLIYIAAGLAAYVVFNHFALRVKSKKAAHCTCGNCGWEGPEFKLHIYVVTELDPFIYNCPECESNKIIWEPTA